MHECSPEQTTAMSMDVMKLQSNQTREAAVVTAAKCNIITERAFLSFKWVYVSTEMIRRVQRRILQAC